MLQKIFEIFKVCEISLNISFKFVECIQIHVLGNSSQNVYNLNY